LNQFAEYIQHGWKICRVEPGTKGPRQTGWNLRENAVSDASNLQGAGLMHAYSGTCALDIDRMDDAAAFLQQHGINLADLLADPAAVQIVSGQPNRGKLIYAMPTPLPSKSFAAGAFELRCGTSTGRTAQDVLPPSVHPLGSIYQWKGDWRVLPRIPEPLLRFWGTDEIPLSLEKAQFANSSREISEILRDIKAIASRIDRNCCYDDWIRLGMALHHETGGSLEGLAFWSEWSKSSPKFRPGDPEVHAMKWASFGNSPTPVTVDSLRRMDRADPADFEDCTAASALLDDILAPQPVLPERSPFLSLMELFQRPEPRWIIEDFLPEATLGVIYGQWGTGKTFIEVDVALSVALGQAWRGKLARQGKVLIVAAEDNRGVQMRLQAGLAARGVQDAPVRVLPRPVNIASPERQKWLLDWIKQETPVSLVFFDTYTAVTPGSDENTVKDVSEIVNYCSRINEATGALVMMVHHKGKGEGVRGSTALPDGCDVMWELDKDEICHELTVKKMKNAQDGGAYKFRLLPVGKSCIVEWL